MGMYPTYTPKTWSPTKTMYPKQSSTGTYEPTDTMYPTYAPFTWSPTDTMYPTHGDYLCGKKIYYKKKVSIKLKKGGRMKKDLTKRKVNKKKYPAMEKGKKTNKKEDTNTSKKSEAK